MQKRKTFRPWQPEQTTLLPPSPREWLSEDHQVYFLLDLVDELDLSEILIPAQAKDPRGEKGFDPRMMTMLLLYAYCVGIVSSRKIERACYEDLAFRVLTGNQQPDHSRISEFRRCNLDALKGLFVQILRLCQKAGMVSLGHVALDGTKLQANASKHKAMSHERMLRAEKELEKEINALIRKAEILDAQEDRRYGKGKLGSELPDELRHKQGRLGKIRQARKEMEAETAAAAARQRQEEAEKARAKATEAEEAGAPAAEQAELRKKVEAAAAKPERPERRRSRLLSTLALSHQIWSPWRLMRCRAVAWRERLMARQRPRPSATSQTPTAISCSPVAPICRATTARWRWTATTR
jgi:transposase